MPELALYDQERDPLAGHLDSVGVPELVGCETAPDSGHLGGPMQLGSEAAGEHAARGSGRAGRRRARRPAGSGAARARDRAAPTAVHPDLPPATTLSSTDEHGAALAVKIGLSSASASLIRSPARQAR